jgi:dTDP-4-dehydrorhamnose reductase
LDQEKLSMRLLILGKNGQVGNALYESLKDDKAIFLERNDLDLLKINKIEKTLEKYHFDILINASAYTQVDNAENDKNNCLDINSYAVEALAKYTFKKKIPFIHFSTDYVFNGEKNKPYKEDDITEPLNFYGYSKLLGENLIRENNPMHLILRTSWVYDHKGKNFFNTILNLAKLKKKLNIVSDQYGSPTSTFFIASILKKILFNLEEKDFNFGTYHISNDGYTSWFDFAYKIISILENKNIKYSLSSKNIFPILSKDYPTIAKRPKFSVLDCSKIKKEFKLSFNNWEESLKDIINQYENLNR